MVDLLELDEAGIDHLRFLAAEAKKRRWRCCATCKSYKGLQGLCVEAGSIDMPVSFCCHPESICMRYKSIRGISTMGSRNAFSTEKVQAVKLTSRLIPADREITEITIDVFDQLFAEERERGKKEFKWQMQVAAGTEVKKPNSTNSTNSRPGRAYNLEFDDPVKGVK
jgi:hypothetical protein